MPGDKPAKKGGIIVVGITDPDFHKELKRSMSEPKSVTLEPHNNGEEAIAATMSQQEQGI